MTEQLIALEFLHPNKYQPRQHEDPVVVQECELIWCMIDDVCSYYTRSSMLTILKKLQERAGKWNVKIPARLTKLAEQFDAEISAAAAPKAAK